MGQSSITLITQQTLQAVFLFGALTLGVQNVITISHC